jgi:hypothetical protein
VLRVLRTVDALGDITTYAGKAARLPGKAAALIRRRVGKGAAGAAEAAEEGVEEGIEEGIEEGADLGADAPGDVARGITRTEGAEGGARRGKKGNKPEMEKVVTSLDGHEFHIDFRTLSGTARHVIRQLEARGWVRVSEILPEDLVQISKWFGREIAEVQSPYGRLRVVLGEENRILKQTIRKGEVFVMHTHPMVSSKSSHFSKDLEKAGKRVEAVIDWSGNITYYSKAGIKNPIRSDGVVEPLLGFEAAFVDARGAIVGFATVDIIDQAAGASVKVLP